MFYNFSGFDTGFGLVRVMVTLIFLIVIGTFVIVAIKGLRQWNRNNHSPRLTIPATVVTKRTNVFRHHHHHGTGMHHSSVSTSYYITFQVDSGDRIEFCVAGREFGLLVEGDRGMLSFQGTRYFGFQREFDA